MDSCCHTQLLLFVRIVFNECSREEEELLAGAPDEFLCPIMSILMTDPVSFKLMKGPDVSTTNVMTQFSMVMIKLYWFTGPGVKPGDTLGKILRDYLEIFLNMGRGVFSIPKTFVN